VLAVCDGVGPVAQFTWQKPRKHHSNCSRPIISCPTWHITAHFRHDPHSQSGLLLKTLSLLNQSVDWYWT